MILRSSRHREERLQPKEGGLFVGAVSIAASFALAAAATADGREPEVLKRTGKWVVNYDEDACHLIGDFGAGENRVLLRFTRYQPGDSFDLAIFGKRVASSAPRKTVRLDFGKGERLSQESWNGKSGDLPVTFMGSVRLDGWDWRPHAEAPTITPEQESAVTGMTVAMEGKRPFRLEFGSLGKPFSLMRHCSTNLVQHWGYDPAVLASLRRPLEPASSPQNWVSFAKYPLEALRAGHNGQVQFRLDVDAEGKVKGCHILARTQPDDFSTRTCLILSRRARFKPALDAQGKPVPAFFVSKFRWQVGI